MKNKTILNGAVMCLIAVSFAACNKSSPDNPPATTNAVVPDAKPVVAEAAAAVTNTVSAVKDQADELITQAKTLIADQKYPEALDALNKMSGLALTPDQQKTVDDLKAQVQKLLSSGTGAVDAAKNLLGK